MECWVYKSQRKPDHYLYVERQNDFTRVPAALQQLLGPLEAVMSLSLTPDRRLANADVGTVIAALRAAGYYLQLPPADVLPDK